MQIRLAVLLLSASSLAQSPMMPTGFVPITTGTPTITFVNGCTNNSTTLTTNCSLSATSGNLLVVTSKTGTSSTVPGTPVITSTSGPSCNWIRLIPTTSGSGGTSEAPISSTMYGCIVPSTGTEQVTVAWTVSNNLSFTDIGVSQWSTTGAWYGGLLDTNGQSQNLTSTTSCATGSTQVATQNPNDLLLAVCQNWNSSQTWGALSGFTNRASSSSTSEGLYSKVLTTTGTQSATVPFSAADFSQGAIVALQASGNVTCAGCSVVTANVANSAGENPDFDHISLGDVTSVSEGHTLVYFVFHSNWSGSGTTTMVDSQGNRWAPCSSAWTSAATSTSMTDLQISSSMGMSCFYSLNISVGGIVTGQPTATDCASGCTFVGGVFMELAGAHNIDGFSHTSTGQTSGTGSNNMNCGSLTTTTSSDMILCTTWTASGTVTAGTTPITFTLRNSTNGNLESGIWSSSGTTTPTETNASTGIAYGGLAIAFK